MGWILQAGKPQAPAPIPAPSHRLRPHSPAAATGGTKETEAFPAARTTDANTPHPPPHAALPARAPHASPRPRGGGSSRLQAAVTRTGALLAALAIPSDSDWPRVPGPSSRSRHPPSCPFAPLYPPARGKGGRGSGLEAPATVATAAKVAAAVAAAAAAAAEAAAATVAEAVAEASVAEAEAEVEAEVEAEASRG
ncbi:forkhead box protein D1-like [Felis catus]|uniref:forkhead box protein D1-like n=1 Tax=Felis catus TaxID=9685 RepID=UPI001D19B92D|nr:forkhead box protein D1-like [Felis catus]